MSGEYPFSSKVVSPAKCTEKPWNLWVSEIGHLSPLRDDDGAFVAPAPAEAKGTVSRRVHDAHPYKAAAGAGARYRRSGLHRLKYDSMSLHGLFPQMDNLNAAVCHMCGVIVKCSAAYRHLVESHAGTEPLLPPPPPASTVRNRSRHKKEPPPPPPVDLLPVKLETSPVHTATAPLSRLVLPQQELQYLEEPSTSSAVTGEVQVCVESGELPVVSIQDTEDLPLGDNLTDDIFAIMNSEGIQTADDITNSADWKNIIRDIGNLNDINFSQTTEPVPPQDLYAPALHTPALPAYALPDAELAGLQFASPPPAAPPPAAPDPPRAPARAHSRAKSSKSKPVTQREYDPNKHCGVLTGDVPKPCTRSLTCKAHALSLRRLVEGRAKPFDTLLAEHRAAKDPATAAAVAAAAAAAPPAAAPPPPAPCELPPLLVNTSIDLTSLNGLTADQQVTDIYASLLSAEEPALVAEAAALSSLLVGAEEERAPAPVAACAPAPPAPPPPPLPADVCWYATCPRPLALCTYNASHAAGAVTLGKRYATVRSNIKSSLSRSQCKAPAATNNFYYGQNALSLSKSVHMNASKTNKPEVRRLVVTCSGRGGGGPKEVHQSLSELFAGAGEARHLNGHVSHAHAPLKPKPASLELGFSLDPLLADEKC